MAKLYEQTLSKMDLLRRVGNLESIAGIQEAVLTDGRKNGLRTYDVKNGKLHFSLNVDKCLDLATLYYEGTPLHFVARPGSMNNLWYADGENSPRSIVGGMMFTCGFSNVGPLQTLDGGRTLPQHGYARTSPAVHHGARCLWQGDEYVMEVTAEMREASLFGENMVLRRTVTTRLGEPSVTVHDVIENENVHAAPLMLMYHCNAGYPLLDEDACLQADILETRCRDEITRRGLEKQDFRRFGPPVDDDEEQVFYHRLASENGRSKVRFINPRLGLGLEIDYLNKELPNLIHWKCRASGDYVTGLEPSNCYPEGLAAQKARGDLRMLMPGESVETELVFTVLNVRTHS